MTDWPPDIQLRNAFRALREDLEATVSVDEARAVIASARAEASRRRRRQRRASVLAVLVLAGAVAGTVPQGREAVAQAVDQLGGFLTGQANPPGRPPPSDEPAALLNNLTDARAGSERVIAQRGNLRMLGYRNSRGDACISIGTAYAFCGGVNDWRIFFTNDLVAPLITTPVEGERIVPLWGLAASQVRELRVIYADGGAVSESASGSGFILSVDGERDPVTLVALGSDGAQLAQADISLLAWRFCAGPEPCP